MENLVKADLKKFYQNKKVLVTGHTGFKGSWLSIWLHELGANVIGLGLDPKNEKDNFNLSEVSQKIIDLRCDIRDKKQLNTIFAEEQPEIVFHLAAQALVIDGYDDPLYTYETNTLGTVNILECVRESKSVHTAICITTDKVYDNKEWIWPYRENDPMGGYDPYSASKGAAELIIASYRNSFFNPKAYDSHNKSIASARAGNVIGGGDWAVNRIIPDCIRAIESNEEIKVRNPLALRPWQHVLEPLYGYLLLGIKLNENPIKYAQAWNFGPKDSNLINVGNLVDKIIKIYGEGSWKDISKPDALHEAKFLALDIHKAKYELNWFPVMDFHQTIQFTVDWYKNYTSENVYNLCAKQINEYESLIQPT